MPNYRTNEDKLCNSDYANYNAIHNVEDITGSGFATEPVSLQELKDYLRLSGFSFDDDSPADEFDFDDDLITSMGVEARMWCEKFTGIHLVPKTLRVTFTNGAGNLRFPGPVTSDITTAVITNRDGAIQSGTVYWVGTLFPMLETQFSYRTSVDYEAGYGTDCPDWAKNAIKAYVAWAFENRGDVDAGSPVRAAAICRPYRKVKIFG